MQYNNTCPICGKLFYVGDKIGYVYKKKLYRDSRYTNTVYYCSWTCYRKAEREIEEAKKKRLKAGDAKKGRKRK